MTWRNVHSILEKSDSNLVKCDCVYVLLSIEKNMIDIVTRLNGFQYAFTFQTF